MANHKKAQNAYMRAVEDRMNTKGKMEEHIDWSMENTLSPFTFDLSLMGDVFRTFKIGRDKWEVNVMPESVK